jgi:hypothetical protein
VTPRRCAPGSTATPPTGSPGWATGLEPAGRGWAAHGSAGVDLASGRFCYQVARKAISASFTAFLEQLLAAYPTAPVVAVICDNVIIHHSKLVKCWLTTHSPTLTIQGRVGQVHAFFHAHSPEQLLATTAPDSSPWLPEGSLQSFSRPPSIQMDSCAKATG